MAELHWGPQDWGPLTFREVFLTWQRSLEKRWTYQSVLLAEIHNQSVILIRLNSRSRPPLAAPEDFHPYSKKKKKEGVTVTAANFHDLRQIGDQLLQMQR